MYRENISLITYNLSFLCKVLLFQELTFFFVIGTSTNEWHNCDSKQDSKTLNPCMTHFFCSCRWHFDDKLKYSTTYQNLKHKVVKSSFQHFAKTRSFRRIFFVCSKMLRSFRQWIAWYALFNRSLKAFKNCLDATKRVVNVVEVFNILSLLVKIDNLL